VVSEVERRTPGALDDAEVSLDVDIERHPDEDRQRRKENQRAGGARSAQ
jgi:hypothetical protein